MESIGKNSKLTLPRQISNYVRENIRRGEWSPGSRLPGERRLAETLQVSRSSIVEALQLLEEEHVIEKVPAKGNFIRDTKVAVKVAFVYPESALPADFDQTEAGFAVSERYRGMVSGAAEANAHLSYVFVPEPKNKVQMENSLRKLMEFDAIVCPGLQLFELRARLAMVKPVVIMDCDLLHPELQDYSSLVFYDRERALQDLTGLVKRGRYAEAMIISWKNSIPEEHFRRRAELFMKFAENAGIQVSSSDDFVIDPGEIDIALKKARGKFIFLNHANNWSFLYSAAEKMGLAAGRDFGMAAICSGLTMQNLNPSCTYIRVPYFKIGRESLKLAVKLGRNSRHFEPRNIIIESEIITGATMRMQ